MTDDWKSKYDSVESFYEGLAKVKLGDDETGKYGYVDTTGKEVVPLKYDYAESFYEGLAKVKLGDDETGKYGYVDQQGQEYWDMSEDEARQQMKNR